MLESDPGVQSLLIDEIVNQVEELCVSRPVALCLDDLHWADASTVAALASLVRRAADLPLLIALAARRIPRGSDLAALIDLLDAAPSFAATRIELAPLASTEVTDLATRFLGAAPGPGLSDLLKGCAGNPLLVVEMLASLREAGLLANKDGRMDTAGDGGDVRLPTTLTETVRRRMARLDEKLQAIATIAALLGSRFTLFDLASITARPATELFPLVQTLVEARLFTDDGVALSYRHDLVRQAVISALPESVRVELHRNIAQRASSGGRAHDAGGGATRPWRGAGVE